MTLKQVMDITKEPDASIVYVDGEFLVFSGNGAKRFSDYDKKYNATGVIGDARYVAHMENGEWVIDKNELTEQPIKVLSDAISTFGVEKQTIKAIEELSELIQALSKTLIGYTNGDNVREEIADVEIMTAQLRMMYDVENGEGSVDDVKEYKLEQLRNTIETKRAKEKKCVPSYE